MLLIPPEKQRSCKKCLKYMKFTNIELHIYVNIKPMTYVCNYKSYSAPTLTIKSIIQIKNSRLLNTSQPLKIQILITYDLSDSKYNGPYLFCNYTKLLIHRKEKFYNSLGIEYLLFDGFVQDVACLFTPFNCHHTCK